MVLLSASRAYGDREIHTWDILGRLGVHGDAKIATVITHLLRNWPLHDVAEKRNRRGNVILHRVGCIMWTIM